MREEDEAAGGSIETLFAWSVGIAGAIFSVVVMAHVLRASGLAPHVE
tara:strand:- start:808 stop:948 length:141 start_codon:yes stop_codon:yes gene_type:complete